MIATLPRITAAVRVAMGMDALATPLLADAPETIDFERRVRCIAPEAARRMVLAMPAARLCPSGRSFADAPVRWQQVAPGCWHGAVQLPADFLRLAAFRLEGWQQAVHEASEDPDPAMLSPWPGIAGGICRPRCRILPGSPGPELHFGGMPSAAAVVQAVYFPVPRIDADGGILIPHDSLSELVELIRKIMDNG